MPKPKKGERFRISEFTNSSGTLSWRVSGTRPNGTRVRQNFSTKPEALHAQAKEEEEAAGAALKTRSRRTWLTADQLSDAENAVRSAPGRPLSRMISRLIDLEKRASAKGADLDGAMACFEGHFRPEATEISIMNAREEFLRTREGLSKRTITNYTSSTAFLLDPDPNEALHRFTVRDLEVILSKFRNLNTKKTRRRVFGVFFNWAVRHHYCLENPCDRLDRIPQPTSRITILSTGEIKKLLVSAVSYRDGLTAAPTAIALFAGLRPSELADLRQADVNSERIRVRGGKMRRKLNRTVPIPTNLSAWLVRYPFTGMPAGWDHKLKILKKATAALKWVPDILRHTSITFQAHRDMNEALTAFNNGTSKDMMDRHYRDVIDDPDVVREFWSLTPGNLPEDVEVTLPGHTDISWPADAKLRKLVWSKPLSHLAGDLGVSDVAIKKHCRKRGIELPPRGYWLRENADKRR